MSVFKNENGRAVLLRMVKAIQKNKQYLGDVDGLIGDGDHGMNMNKGFSLYETELGDHQTSFSDGLFDLGTVLLNKIGGSMGPIYGTIFMSMSDAEDDEEVINPQLLTAMFKAALDGLYEIVDARPGDKTLVDTLYPAYICLKEGAEAGRDFRDILPEMKLKAKAGMESTVDMVAKFGRSARLGERSRGVQDAGATSCCIIIESMADGIISVLED